MREAGEVVEQNRICMELKTVKGKDDVSKRSISGLPGCAVINKERCDPDHLSRKDLLPPVEKVDSRVSKQGRGMKA